MHTAARSLHRDLLDPWVAPPYIDVIEIVGVGLDTIKGFNYQQFHQINCAGTICIKNAVYEPVPVFTQYGDETVVAFSAEAYPGDKTTYYVDLLEVKNDKDSPSTAHVNLPNLPSLQQFISEIIQGSSTLPRFMYGTQPSFNTEREVVSVHSPVTLTLIDGVGNRVGKTGEGQEARIHTDIPGSSYFEFAGSTYIVLPRSIDYTAHIEGIAEGSYTLVRTLLAGEDEPTLLSELSAATVTPTMVVEFSKVNGAVGDIKTDYDGDGVVDVVVTADGERSTIELFATLRAQVQSFTLLKKNEQDWLLSSLSKAEATGKRKGYRSSAVLKIFSQIDTKLMQYVGQGRVTEAEYNTFMSIIAEIKTR
jgi:hypothetical protein